MVRARARDGGAVKTRPARAVAAVVVGAVVVGAVDVVAFPAAAGAAVHSAHGAATGPARASGP